MFSFLSSDKILSFKGNKIVFNVTSSDRVNDDIVIKAEDHPGDATRLAPLLFMAFLDYSNKKAIMKTS